MPGKSATTLATAARQTSATQTESVRLGVVVIGRKRPGFDQEWNEIIRARAWAALKTLGYDYVGHDAHVVDDDSLIAALNQVRQFGAEALVVLQPSIGNGQLALALVQQWPQPIVLWATPERPEGEKVSSCSLVAQHLWASIFRQAGHPFEIIVGDPDESAVRQSLGQAVNICRAAESIRTAKLGAIGSSAPGFIPMQADPMVLSQARGAQLQAISLVQFIERVRLIDANDANTDLEQVRQLKIPMNGVTLDDLAMNSRYYLAMKQVIADERLDVLALQCWPELPGSVGHWPYLALSRMADEGIAVSMEGDADGALLCRAAHYLGAGVGFITDWLEHDPTTITLWHGGTAPLSMCYPIGSKNGPSLGTHFNNARPTVVEGELRAGEPVTLARLWRCDGSYHMTAFEGRTIPPTRRLSGNWARVEVAGGNVPDWFDTLCHAGVPHHPLLFYGKHTQQFRRLARLLGIHWLQK